MRFGTQFTLQSMEGQERTTTKFLWYPRQFGTDQWRWLEWAMIKEAVLKIDIGGSMQWGRYKWAWVEIDFVDA